ncbi:MAG: hypothetical protein CSB48_08525 [Proteobacteria bacterium]|nr:MAG: hypothetical protein CSB48_08525 [Pseudomonadota bacterium]
MKRRVKIGKCLLQLCRAGVCLVLCALLSMTVNGEESGNSGEESGSGESEELTEEQSTLVGQKKEWAAREKARSLVHFHLAPEASDHSALENELTSLTPHWLKSTAEETEFLLLERKERSGTPQGAALLIPGMSQHADWPSIVRPVMQRLSETGWYSYSMSMPYATEDRIPGRELAAKQFDTYTPRVAEEGESDVDETASGGESPEKSDKNDANSNEQSDPEQTDQLDKEQTNPEEPNTEEPDTEEPESESERTAVSDKQIVEIGLNSPQQQVASEMDGTGHKQEKQASVQEVVASRLEASFEFIKSSGYENIVFIAIGNGADAALDYLIGNKDKIPVTGFAMIWITPDFSAGRVARLEKALDGLQAPLLDIVDSLDLPRKALANERKRIARGSRMQRYYQAPIPISGQWIVQKKSTLPYRVSAWLKKNAPAIRTKKSTLQVE